MRSKGRTTGTDSRQDDRGQLRLLPGDRRSGRQSGRRSTWALDERTKRLGREGVAAIRETLRRAQPPEPFQRAS